MKPVDPDWIKQPIEASFHLTGSSIAPNLTPRCLCVDHLGAWSTSAHVRIEVIGLDQQDNFPGDGEMERIIRGYDWSSSPLGPIASWPEALKTAVRIMLTSRFPMWMAWGNELTFLYNETYARVTMGKKHPWGFGRPTQEVWVYRWIAHGFETLLAFY